MHLPLKLARLPFVKNVPLGPALWISAGAQLFLAILLAYTPLFNLLGYEFCVAMSLLVSVLSGPLGISAVRHARADSSWLSIWFTALLAGWATSIPAFIVISLNALRIQNCNYAQGVVLFILLPLSTFVICSGWAVAIGIMFRRRFIAGAVFAALWLAVAGFNIWEVWSGPQVLSYNQLAGWIAGPIYDDVIQPGLPLLMSRTMGLASSLALLLLSSWIDSRAMLKINHQKIWAALMFIAAMLSVYGLWAYSGELGFGRQSSTLDRLLPATTRTKHFIIHHSANLDAAERDMLALEHEFCLHQIKQLLGDYRIPPIDSWVFSDFSQKRKILGAGWTQYTKPWQPAIYINGASVPHSTLKHELVHAYASAFGSGPLAVSATHGIFINPGLTEGLAVAVDWPHSGRFAPHTWSAALKKIGKLPAIKNLFDPIGFWTASSSRSYTVAGSFVRFLLDTYGAETLERAYSAGTLDGVYPVPTAKLIEKWERFLDGINLPPWVEELARSRFSGKSVFYRTCAHEIAALRAKAEKYAYNKQFEKARKTFREILSHVPTDFSSRRALMAIDMKEHKTDEALAIAEQLISQKNLSSAQRTGMLSMMSDFMRRSGKLKRSVELQTKVLQAHLSDGSDRTAVVKIQAMSHPKTSKAIFELLDAGKSSALVLLDLRETVIKEPLWSDAWYLLGRQLYNRKKYSRAFGYLWHAGILGLEHPSLAAENLRLLATSLYYLMFDSKDDARATAFDEKALDRKSIARSMAMFLVMAQYPRHEGELLMAQNWIQRLSFINNDGQLATLTQ